MNEANEQNNQQTNISFYIYSDTCFEKHLRDELYEDQHDGSIINSNKFYDNGNNTNNNEAWMLGMNGW